MNYLAHLYLSGDDEAIMTGNFIGDHVKGNAMDSFSPGIRKGIWLHRKIDEYTDSHPIFLMSKGRLAARYRKYSGVIVDMYYDHFLACNWHDYSDEPLASFTRRVYRSLLNRITMLPPRTRVILPAMAASDWLSGYSSLAGLQKALIGMAGRTAFPSGMETAIEALTRDYEQYQNEFRVFFPQVTGYVNDLLRRKW
ncbi:MAG: DUF479 domain-containing protein [Bacteroidales bacterium]|nr:DUF479 domain-containing protein [Bacteroidales bacterium]